MSTKHEEDSQHLWFILFSLFFSFFTPPLGVNEKNTIYLIKIQIEGFNPL